MSRMYVISALFYAIAGLLLGIYMAATKNHGQLVTHAHIMLAGFVVSFVYGLCYKLWLGDVRSKLSSLQFVLHQAGVLVLSLGLFLLYGMFVAPESIDPVLALSSIAVLLGMILMTVMFFRGQQQAV
ncbi:TonB-dependent receptor [Haliea sp. E17]|uniref:TonB-dependent receptor n=1 Tax=Haliea sp. E17 TaxID=3401576 RepID=UPI003AAFBA85